MNDEIAARPGTTVDLSRRMDRMERNHEELAKQVNDLKSTISQVELNQRHAEELNRLRFNSLDTAISGIDTNLETFITRINGIIEGTIETSQSAQGKKVLADYEKWRDRVDSELDDLRTFKAQGKLIGRVVTLLVSGNVIAIIAAIAAVLKPS